MKLAGKVVLGTVGGLFALGAAGAAGAAMSAGSTSVHAVAKPAAKPAAKASKYEQNQDKAAAIVGCLGDYHVQRVQLTRYGTADVFTSWTGGFASADQGAAKLTASRFAQCASTDDLNGYVSVYGADGDLLANGSF